MLVEQDEEIKYTDDSKQPEILMEDETKQGTASTLGSNNADLIQAEDEKIELTENSVGSNDEQSKDDDQAKTVTKIEEITKMPESEAKDPEQATEIQTGSDSFSVTTADTKVETQANKKKYGGKYELIDRIFDFILLCPKNTEINPVLSGYFQKVVLALLGYKQKQVMNYIYTKENLIEKMIDHVYDKSICDVIIKVLNISNSTSATSNNSINNDSGEIFGSPSKPNSSKDDNNTNFKQSYESNRNEIINKLIDKLIRAKNVEEYWNASAIL